MFDTASQIADGTFVSQDGSRVFGVATTGAIIAIDAWRGSVGWWSNASEFVAGATQDWVVGYRPIRAPTLNDGRDPQEWVELTVFAASTGQVAMQARLSLPPWASTTRLGCNFRIGARGDGEAVLVAWETSTQYAGGIPPTQSMQAAARQHSVELFRLSPREALRAKVTSLLDARSPYVSNVTNQLWAGTNRGLDRNEFGAWIWTDNAGGQRYVVETEPGRNDGSTVMVLYAFRQDAVVWSFPLRGPPVPAPLPP